MEGHLDLTSAGKHYAPASSGWANEAVLPEPVAVPINKNPDSNDAVGTIGDYNGGDESDEGKSSAGLDVDSNGGAIDAKVKSTEQVEAGASPRQHPARSFLFWRTCPARRRANQKRKDAPPDMAARNGELDKKADEIEEIAGRLRPCPWQEAPQGWSFRVDHDDDG